MAIFQVGETVICTIEVRDDTHALRDCATSMNIEIEMMLHTPEIIIISSVMIRDGNGKYHYDFDSASKAVGDYVAKYTATDGARITIEKDKFHLER